MIRGSLAEGIRLAGFTLLGALIGLGFGAGVPGTLLGVGAWAVHRVREIHRFDRWIDQSIGRPPALSGLLEDFAYRIWRQRISARRRTQRIAHMLRRLQRSTNELPDAAILLRGRDEITWFNRAARAVFGLQSRDVGRNLSGLTRSPEIVALVRSTQPGEPIETPSPLDASRTLDVRMIDFGESQRLVLARDISQVAQLRTMRQDFVANVSHELRTPLTVMLGYLEVLNADTDAETARQTLARLQSPARRMKGLVEDLLLLSRLDTGSPPAGEALETVNGYALLQRLRAEALQMSAGAHVIDVEADQRLGLLGVEQELHSAFANLITNAIRYSPEGGTIGIAWYEYDGRARLEVRDEGIGIAPEHIERLTERFYRVDVGRSRQVGGTGLGLAIVKHILRRHGSELEIESQPGAGSTFACEFAPERARMTASELPPRHHSETFL